MSFTNTSGADALGVRSSSNRSRILIIEDSEEDYTLLLREFQKTGIPIHASRVENFADLKNSLQYADWDVVISDNKLEGSDLTICVAFQLVEQLRPKTPFIIVSGTLSEDKAIEYMNLGVTDYILKDNLMRMAPLVRRILKHAEDQFRKSEFEKTIAENDKRFKLLAQNIRDVFFIVDKEIRCTYWNAAAEKLTGIKEETALGQNIFQLFPGIRGTEIEERLMQSISSQEIQTMDVVNYRYNYKYRYGSSGAHYQVSIYPSYGMHSILIKDVTKTVHAEERLKDTNEELEAFMYRVSHDIRGPVASLMGLINLAKAESHNEPSEYLVQGEKITNRLDDLVSDLAGVAKIYQDDVQLNVINIHDVFKKTSAKLIARNKDKTEITFVMQEGVSMRTDRNLLELVFSKIMQNAIDYKRPGIKSMLNVRVSKDDGVLKITFEDNGIGISPDVYAKIFTMFFRGNVNSPGSGLGLYMVKRAVEKLKGTIEVKSKLNTGTLFTVWLPEQSRTY